MDEKNFTNHLMGTELRTIISAEFGRATNTILENVPSETRKLVVGPVSAAITDATNRVMHRIIADNQKISLKIIVTEYLQRYRIPAHIKGYEYLRSAIIFCVQDSSVSNMITKDLYPDVAKLHHTISRQVEAAIRHAIDSAWRRGGHIYYLHDFSLDSANFEKRRPTNTEFIATIADKIRLSHPEVL